MHAKYKREYKPRHKRIKISRNRKILATVLITIVAVLSTACSSTDLDPAKESQEKLQFKEDLTIAIIATGTDQGWEGYCWSIDTFGVEEAQKMLQYTPPVIEPWYPDVAEQAMLEIYQAFC